MFILCKGVVFWMTYIIVYSITDLAQYGPKTFHSIKIIAIVFAGLGYLFNVYESLFRAKEKAWVSKPKERHEYVQDLVRVTPKVHIRVEGYANTVAETMKVPVINLEAFIFSHWKDESELPELSATKVNYLNLKYSVMFADSITSLAFERQKKQFIENSTLSVYKNDIYTTLSKTCHQQVLLHNNQVAWWMKPKYYTLCTIMVLSWPYRILLKRNIVEHNVTIKKSFSIVPMRGGHLNENIPVETTSYVTDVIDNPNVPSDTLPLTNMNRSNLTIAPPPSYIEVETADMRTNGQPVHQQLQEEPPSYEEVIINSTTTTGL